MGALKRAKTIACGLAVAGAALLIAGCGPNDRLRDDYMGKPKPEEFKPIERDQYGNPIIPGQSREDTPVQRDEYGNPILPEQDRTTDSE